MSIKTIVLILFIFILLVPSPAGSVIVVNENWIYWAPGSSFTYESVFTQGGKTETYTFSNTLKEKIGGQSVVVQSRVVDSRPETKETYGPVCYSDRSPDYGYGISAYKNLGYTKLKEESIVVDGVYNQCEVFKKLITEFPKDKNDKRTKITTEFKIWKTVCKPISELKNTVVKRTFFKNGKTKIETAKSEVIHRAVPMKIGNQTFYCDLEVYKNPFTGIEQETWITDEIPLGLIKTIIKKKGKNGYVETTNVTRVDLKPREDGRKK